MNEDEESPEWQAVQKALFDQIMTLASNFTFNKALMEKMQEVCDDCTKKARQRGLRFPEMIITYFTECREVRIFRHDATNDMIWIYAHNFVREVPHVKPDDLYAGFIRAFPNWKPDRMFSKREDLRNG